MKPLYSKNKDYIKTNSSFSLTFSFQVLNNGFGGLLKTFNFEPYLKNITCATLILVGEKDWINDPIHLQQVATIIPNVRLEILKDFAHFVAIDQHELHINLIRMFLQNSSGS
jgi:proline iminopeptidase